jgi:hypothetical protein
MVSRDLQEFVTRPVPTGHVFRGRHLTKIGSSIVKVFTHVRTPAEEPIPSVSFGPPAHSGPHLTLSWRIPRPGPQGDIRVANMEW